MKLRNRITALVAISAAGALALAGCSGGTTQANGKTVITMLADTPANLKESKSIIDLTNQYIKDGHPNISIKFEYVPQVNLNQKIQLLAGEGKLPTVMNAGNATSIAKGLYKNGLLLDLASTFKKLGIADSVTATGQDLAEKAYGSPMISIPKEANIEGWWYNKKIFAAQGIAVPATWDEFLAACAKLKAAGVQPSSTPGAPTIGWPITRMIGEYDQRLLGGEAMTKVAEGKAKLTDPGYIEGAKAIADLGAKGYFGNAVASQDYQAAENQFLTGQTALWYMGSWAVGEFNQPGNTIGNDNIGFFPFPSVDGGKGNDLTFMEPGEGVVFSKKAYESDPALAGWMKYVFSRFGDQMIKVSGVVSGFKITSDTSNLPYLTKLVYDHVQAAKNVATWFDTDFPAQATVVGNTNAGLYLSGQLSSEDYMAKIQQAIESAK